MSNLPEALKSLALFAAAGSLWLFGLYIVFAPPIAAYDPAIERAASDE